MKSLTTTSGFMKLTANEMKTILQNLTAVAVFPEDARDPSLSIFCVQAASRYVISPEIQG